MPFQSNDPANPRAVFTYEPTGEVRNGRPLYCVTNDISYWHDKFPGIVVRVKPGFVTDLASIPAIPFFPKPGGSLWDDAAIIHDKAGRGRGMITTRDADALFYYAMRDRGCTIFTALVLWSCVRGAHILLGQKRKKKR